jgi:hypothetical protein
MRSTLPVRYRSIMRSPITATTFRVPVSNRRLWLFDASSDCVYFSNNTNNSNYSLTKIDPAPSILTTLPMLNKIRSQLKSWDNSEG